MEKHLLGEIFISHSSLDKPFVRRLARRIEKSGFSVWLDEKELIAGEKAIFGWQQSIDAFVVFADLSKLGWDQQCAVLKNARELLLRLAKRLSAQD